jgi:hypothetical protein
MCTFITLLKGNVYLINNYKNKKLKTKMQTVQKMKTSYMGKRHVLPINNAGLYRKALVDEPIKEVEEG